jgi:MFS transporter, DHA1 family, inner membrane transport protein
MLTRIFGRLLDDSFEPEIRHNISIVILGRLVANACYRFAPPFLAIIAKDFNVSLSDIGVALFVSELSGFASPFAGRIVDRLTHRNAMVIGLVGTLLGCAIAAAAPSVYLFAVGVTVLALTKQRFDLGLGAWIADHVPYQQRGRIVGLTETSWALGLLVGVSLMGLITAATNWRIGYMFGISCLVVVTTSIAKRVNSKPRVVTPHVQGAKTRVHGRGWLVVVTMFCIMSCAQSLFVTFGAWLQDQFGFGAARLAAVGFALGAVELFASLNSAQRTDGWGKERSIAAGALLIVPAGILLAIASSNIVLGLIAVGVYYLGFEFAVVSLLPIASQLVPNSPGAGLGWVLGAGTLGRAIIAIVGTRAYEKYGVDVPALIGSGFGVLAAISILTYKKLGGAH